MYCPQCGFLNLPGVEACANCQQSLTAVETSLVHDRLEACLANDSVEKLLPTSPICVSDDASLAEVMQTMVAKGVGAVLVTDGDGILIGILTERDFLTKVAGQPDLGGLAVRDYMSPHPETVQTCDSMAVAIGKMASRGYRHLPIVDNGRPVGMISVRDILRYITHLFDDKSHPHQS